MGIDTQFIICHRKGYPVVLQKLSDNIYSWCVQYAGNGKYFVEFKSAVDYMRSRKWIK